MQSLNKRRITHVCFSFFMMDAHYRCGRSAMWSIQPEGDRQRKCATPESSQTREEDQEALWFLAAQRRLTSYAAAAAAADSCLQLQPFFPQCYCSTIFFHWDLLTRSTYLPDPNLPTRSPTDHIRYHSRPNNTVLPLPHLSLANCTSPILRDFLNMTGLKSLCEPAKFEIFAEF